MNESMEDITQHSTDQFFYFQLSITSGLPESFNDLFIFFFCTFNGDFQTHFDEVSSSQSQLLTSNENCLIVT